MNKLTIASALLLAANGTGTATTYDDAEYPCFEWDDSTSKYVAGEYTYTFADSNSTDNSAGKKYNYAFDLSLEATGSDYECDQVFKSAWSVEWTVSTDDAKSADPMFTIYYEDWSLDSTTSVCSGTYANDTSTAYVSATDISTNKTVCAYDVWFNY